MRWHVASAPRCPIKVRAARDLRQTQVALIVPAAAGALDLNQLHALLSALIQEQLATVPADAPLAP